MISKLEEFLRVVEEQRENHLRRTPGLDPDRIFSEADMREILKRWVDDYRSWMNAQTVQQYERLRAGRNKGDGQKARALLRSAFSTYQFQVLGNKHLLRAFIQHPLCSAAQPAAAIRQFIAAWGEGGREDQEKNDGEDEGPRSPGTRGRWTRSRSRTRRE